MMSHSNRRVFLGALLLGWSNLIFAESLSQTGLYEDFAAKQVAPQNRHFVPNYVLWSDGAAKKRWIYIPEGQKVDSSDPNLWVFPVGTKIWKEFSFLGRRVETRYMEKTAEGSSADKWTISTYAWNASESDAELVSPLGQKNVAPTGLMNDGSPADPVTAGVLHDIPRKFECVSCHTNGGDPVFSFSAIQLVDAPGDLTLRRLIDEGLFSDSSTLQNIRIHGRDPQEQQAIGYLHANCGHCHGPGGSSFTELHMRYDVVSEFRSQIPAIFTGLNQLTTGFEVPGRTMGVDSRRIEGGSPEFSAIFLRMSNRGSFVQMPKYGSKAVDREGLSSVEEWIKGLGAPFR